MHTTLAASLLGAFALALNSCTNAPAPAPQPSPQELAGPNRTESARAESAPGDADEVAQGDARPPATTRPEVLTLEYKVTIAAPVDVVWNTMLDPEGYTAWTAPFMAGSYFEGTWAEGERMRFLAPGGSGMVAEIAVNRRHELISIRHLGFVYGGVEDTTSDAVRSWAPAYENYHFASVDGGTEVTVVHEVFASFEAQMNATWPRALAALEALCLEDAEALVGDGA